MARYLVVGGAGRTGRRIAEQLLHRGHSVSILSRHPGPGLGPGIEAVQGDLATLEADNPALRDIDGAVVSVEPPADAAGAEAVLHRGVSTLAAAAFGNGYPLVLVSQIYITRPQAYPHMAAVITARGRGEQALRASGASYAIVRPGWLHDDPARAVRLEQGDTGDGPVSRDTVATACATALLTPVTGITFEVFDADGPPPDDWPAQLRRLAPDPASHAADA